jgi:hypothetical protein
VARLRQVALNAICKDDINDIIGRLKAKAKEGDLAAITLLFCYKIDKPDSAWHPCIKPLN